jgi:hypothetical protein
MHLRESIRHDDKAASRFAPHGLDGRFDLYVGCPSHAARNAALASSRLSATPPFGPVGGAQQYRWGYRKAKRLGGPEQRTSGLLGI